MKVAQVSVWRCTPASGRVVVWQWFSMDAGEARAQGEEQNAYDSIKDIDKRHKGKYIQKAAEKYSKRLGEEISFHDDHCQRFQIKNKRDGRSSRTAAEVTKRFRVIPRAFSFLDRQGRPGAAGRDAGG